MSHACFRWFPRMITALMISMLIAGCDDKNTTSSDSGSSAPSSSAKPGNILGKYENANDKITIELKADGKATMIDEGKTTDVTWEMDGADKLVIHGQEGMNLLLRINSDGNLADNMGMGSVFKKK